MMCPLLKSCFLRACKIFFSKTPIENIFNLSKIFRAIIAIIDVISMLNHQKKARDKENEGKAMIFDTVTDLPDVDAKQWRAFLWEFGIMCVHDLKLFRLRVLHARWKKKHASKTAKKQKAEKRGNKCKCI